MIERGFRNVKIVHGGTATSAGEELEKYFEYYRGGKIINPITGKVMIIKP
jgi:hypothetical protein